MSSRGCLPVIVLIIFLSDLCSTVNAQFYAPDTEYHDNVQRHFVVELSRVLAWRQNQTAAGPKVAEITYAVSTADDHSSHWTLRWLDAAGKPVREFAVNYSADALISGTAWYRDVARQVGLVGNGKAAPADSLATGYWQGMASAAPSRTDSLTAAFALAPEKEPARLSGLLAQAALPSVGCRVSLDGVLLARAAAWLCVAEGDKHDLKNDSLWAPILFLSGRENAATTLWKSSPKAEAPVAKWWNLLLSRARSQEVFAAAADPQFRRWVMPALTYEARLHHLGLSLFDVLAKVYPDDESLAPFHDYGPFLAQDTSVGGGRLLEGAYPALSRVSLAACLRKLPPDPAGFQGYADALKSMPDHPAQATDDQEASLAGWAEATPLLNLGCHEGRGKLTPVAIVTARDLLNYGWEMNGLQMRARRWFLTYRFGDAEGADTIAKAVMGGVDGSEVFFVDYPGRFRNLPQPPEVWKYATRTHLTDLGRLQETGGLDGAWAYPGRVFDEDRDKNKALVFRRRWLLSDQAAEQSREMLFTSSRDDLAALLHRMHLEGGPSIDSVLLPFLGTGLTPEQITEFKGHAEALAESLAAVSEPDNLFTDVIAKTTPLPPFESAQRLEKFFWQRPGSNLPYHEIFWEYLRSHAYESAKRYYAQAEPFLDEPVGFSNEIGAQRFTLALLENDRSAMMEALKASGSGSATNMDMLITTAAFLHDDKKLDQFITMYHDRYPAANPKDDTVLQLKGFLPLMPALGNQADPKHAEAMDYFAKNKDWAVFQWVVLHQAKLPAQEAARFLGGKETDPERRMMVAYLLGDKELFARTYDDYEAAAIKNGGSGHGWNKMNFVVDHWLRNELLAIPVPAAQPDLKPPGAQSLSGAFLAKWKK